MGRGCVHLHRDRGSECIEVIARGGESGVAVNTPALPTQRMSVTSALEAAVPESESSEGLRQDLWGLLVALAILALWLEWWLYYSDGKEKGNWRRAGSTLRIPNLRGARRIYRPRAKKQEREARTSGVAS